MWLFDIEKFKKAVMADVDAVKDFVLSAKVVKELGNGSWGAAEDDDKDTKKCMDAQVYLNTWELARGTCLEAAVESM